MIFPTSLRSSTDAVLPGTASEQKLQTALEAGLTVPGPDFA
jgi:hypothetical protein